MSRRKPPKTPVPPAKGNKVPILGKGLAELQAHFRDFRNAKERLNSFITGYKAAAGVPADWALNVDTWVFELPPKKKETPTESK
ncbi:hypothetical protein LCGC14_1420550 [marine sediment metagenome]|uniref:Uncharacterized protein n=1 Tax=marine sediment metagenome TaxID=412755 RepID=A0A0F9M728_9ZZZZ